MTNDNLTVQDRPSPLITTWALFSRQPLTAEVTLPARVRLN